MDQESGSRRVVIVGGGFAGLFAARALSSAPVQVTLLDRAEHLSQPDKDRLRPDTPKSQDGKRTVSFPKRSLQRSDGTSSVNGSITTISHVVMPTTK